MVYPRKAVNNKEKYPCVTRTPKQPAADNREETATNRPTNEWLDNVTILYANADTLANKFRESHLNVEQTL